MNILLVEPDYYTKYPPLGLMKIASYNLSRGNKVKLVRGTDFANDFNPDEIVVTSLFTYAWKSVHKAIGYYHRLFPLIPIEVGGIYASLMPEHIKSAFPYVNVHVGLQESAEKYPPNYDILKDVDKWKNWNSSILFSTRGCIRHCPFCAVPKIEGKFRVVTTEIDNYICDGHKKVILWDNNFLASPNWKDVVGKLKDTGLEVDFNQGLDARLISDEKANLLSELKMPLVRMGYDSVEEKKDITKAVDLFSDYGVTKRNILFYSLYNFYDHQTGSGDSPSQFLSMTKDVLELGCVSYPMRFEPLNSLVKNQYVSPLWTEKELEFVAKARRVIGFGGVFPPYTGLIKKFNEAGNFEEAFALRPIS